MSLRVCSLAARGLWVEMLAIMGISEKYGHLQIGGVPITMAQLGVMAGCTEQEATALVAELERNGVFSRDENGVAYCRRMAREGLEYAQAADYGRMGGNPLLVSEKQEARNEKQEARSPLTHSDNPPLRHPLTPNVSRNPPRKNSTHTPLDT